MLRQLGLVKLSDFKHWNVNLGPSQTTHQRAADTRLQAKSEIRCFMWVSPLQKLGLGSLIPVKPDPVDKSEMMIPPWIPRIPRLMEFCSRMMINQVTSLLVALPGTPFNWSTVPSGAKRTPGFIPWSPLKSSHLTTPSFGKATDCNHFSGTNIFCSFQRAT